MKILRNTITIVSEIIVLFLAILWYIQNKEFEPLIVIILTLVGLVSGFLSRFYIRPKLVLHKQINNWGRIPKAFVNIPQQIVIGINHAQQHWELNWNYELEIRNNSSETAYYIEIDYENLPPNTYVDGQIGKIEPLLPHDKKTFEIKIFEDVVGTYIDAENYLKINAEILTGKLIIKLKYKGESNTSYCTIFNWKEDVNTF